MLGNNGRYGHVSHANPYAHCDSLREENLIVLPWLRQRQHKEAEEKSQTTDQIEVCQILTREERRNRRSLR
jgi:hypothetical protein